MEAYKLEVLDPKALKLIKGMQDLKLIKITKEPVSSVRQYLKKNEAKCFIGTFIG